MFPAQIWGTVGQWFAAIGTNAAVASGVFVIARDRHYRRLEHIDRISIRLDRLGVDLRYAEPNLRQHGIYEKWEQLAIFYAGASYADHRQGAQEYLFVLNIHNPTDLDVTNIQLRINPYTYLQYRRVLSARGRQTVYIPKYRGRSDYNRWVSTRVFRDISLIGMNAPIRPKQTVAYPFTVSTPHFLFTPQLVMTDGHGRSFVKNIYTGKTRSRTSRRINASTYLRKNFPYPLGSADYGTLPYSKIEDGSVDPATIESIKARVTTELLTQLEDLVRNSQSEHSAPPRKTTLFRRLCRFLPLGQ